MGRDDEADLRVLFESGSCRVTVRRQGDAWLLHDQARAGTRVDGDLVDLGYR